MSIARAEAFIIECDACRTRFTFCIPVGSVLHESLALEFAQAYNPPPHYAHAWRSEQHEFRSDKYYCSPHCQGVT